MRCETEKQEKPVTGGSLNPLSVGFVFTIFKMSAQLLLKLGVEDWLEKQAEKTKTEIDDVAVKAVIGFIRSISGT